MTRAIDPGSIIPYVLEADRELPDGHADKPVFYLKPLTHAEQTRIDDNMAESTTKGRRAKKEGSSMKFKLGTNMTLILDAGLERWENLRTPNGIEVSFPEAPVKKERARLYDYLTNDVKGELADAIVEGNVFMEDEIKNSVSQDSSSPEG